ncbi:cyclic nucleotide-binding domain-containing protein [Hyalangium sp.]|uniref:Crp/Fnr family transcriptional regulator n=1 Tax=Hyalangium sp. TaxID=2028555 RepID=UPI002D3E2CCA|nr:cyclic nucleotide-binding domain-containing protein [Hyalangium sp.]HYH94908.1 cyclic nucleotide-binding domain-containing protein [Hyalangium sp.]
MSRIANTEVIVPKSLSPEARSQLIDALYAVHNQIFDGVERQSFAKYVVESKAEHTWIQVHKSEAGEIVGYFAFHIFERQLGGVPTAVFRAEAGSLRAYRGSNVNARFGLSLALRYLLKNPGRRAYYLGSLVHPSSYAVFARYCGEVWPRQGAQTPPELQSFMEELAAEFGLEKVDAARPLVRKVGWKTRETEAEREYWQHCDKPAARFFIEANPGYVNGDGLVTVVPATAANILSVIRALGERKLRQPVEAAVSLARRLPLGARLSRSEIVRQLKAVPLFSQFDQATLKAVATRAQILNMSAGRIVFREGDVSNELYLLARGAAYVLEGGEEQVVNELGSGAVFGEIAMLAGERRSASIRTAMDSTLVRIPREVLLPLIETNVGLRQDVWKTFAERRFESLVRGVERYGQLGRQGRRSWLQQGEHCELAPQQVLTVEPGTHLLVLSGSVEFAHAAPQLAAQGALLLEVEHPLRVVAQETARVVLLPRGAVLAREASLPKAA